MAYKLNTYDFTDEYTIIHIIRRNGDKFDAIIDNEDYEKIKNMCWHASWHIRTKDYYVEYTKYLGIGNKPQYLVIPLHKFILNPDGDDDVDHINGNTFDNRKINLRIAEHPDNLKNRQRKNINNTSGYRNVSWDKRRNKWIVQLQVNGKNTVLGEFELDELDKAGIFAEEMRQKYYGIYAGKS